MGGHLIVFIFTVDRHLLSLPQDLLVDFLSPGALGPSPKAQMFGAAYENNSGG